MQVDGIFVRGNPASYEDMAYLYKQVMTTNTLRSFGVSVHDEVYACFTAGAPAMKHYLMLGYSTLHMPQKREFYVANMGETHTTIHQVPIVELMRSDEVFGVLKELLHSRQFPEAYRLMESTRFSYFEGYDREMLSWIQVLHQRYLFCFAEALNIAKKCRFAFEQEHFFQTMLRELHMLQEGMEKYEEFSAINAKETSIRMLIAEYLHKVLFFWNSKHWNEFAFIASSFYEWLLQLAFYDAIGFSFAGNNKERSKWYDYLNSEMGRPHFPNWLQLNYGRPINSDRNLYKFVLKQSSNWSTFENSEWCRKMDIFYREIRNKSVHRLRGTEEKEIIDILGPDWPDQTIQVLQKYFELEVTHSKFEKAIEQFLERLNQMFEDKYITRQEIGITY